MASEESRLKRLGVLIDTWWNVNIARDSKLKQAIDVLIDTWWNVNDFVSSNVSVTALVLIDTWWNVNLHFVQIVGCGGSGFNRYMVECE